MILYKLNNNNNISWWEIYQDGNDYVISWGQDVTTKDKAHSNINVYNTPSPERAEAEIESRINEQIERKGYSKDRPTNPPDLPMLAQTYDSHYEKVKNGTRDDFLEFALQPKLDGLRCIGTRHKITTRRNLVLKSCPHIEYMLSGLPEDIKLDGELYIHGTDLQTIQSYVRRNKPHKLSKLIQYHVFDIVDTEMPFHERYELLKQVVGSINEYYKQMEEQHRSIPSQLRTNDIPASVPIVLVPTQFYSMKMCTEQGTHLLKQELKSALKQGYEGVIIRKKDHKYGINYRSPHLLKYKQRLDNEFEIIDIAEGYNKTGIFVCKTSEGAVFEATPAWTTERKRSLLVNKELYIGRMLTVEYEKLSTLGIPLKPVGKTTREIG